MNRRGYEAERELDAVFASGSARGDQTPVARLGRLGPRAPTPGRFGGAWRSGGAWAVALAATLVVGPPSAEAHPHHFARGEAVLNAKTGHLEVSVSVEAAALAKAAKVRNVEDPAAAEETFRARLVDYLGHRFKVRTQRGWATLKLAGWEPDGQRMWIYFEMLDVKRVHGLAITCRLLFDVEPAQVNTLRVKAGAFGRSLVFDRDHPTRVVDATANSG